MIKLTSERFYLREIFSTDVDLLFELDSDPLVAKYVGNNPVKTKEQMNEIIAMIRQQYVDNGIGRWAVLEKETDQFIGWAGLKYFTTEINGHQNFYELGYRFIPKFWGKGYATELAKVLTKYAFEQYPIDTLYAYTDAKNFASIRVLEKAGFERKNSFLDDGEEMLWLEHTKK